MYMCLTIDSITAIYTTHCAIHVNSPHTEGAATLPQVATVTPAVAGQCGSDRQSVCKGGVSQTSNSQPTAGHLLYEGVDSKKDLLCHHFALFVKILQIFYNLYSLLYAVISGFMHYNCIPTPTQTHTCTHTHTHTHTHAHAHIHTHTHTHTHTHAHAHTHAHTHTGLCKTDGRTDGECNFNPQSGWGSNNSSKKGCGSHGGEEPGSLTARSVE